MELRRAMEVLLRTTPSQFTSCFPSTQLLFRLTPRRLLAHQLSSSPLPSITNSRRCLSTTPFNQQQAAAAKKDDEDRTAPQQPREPLPRTGIPPRHRPTPSTSTTRNRRDPLSFLAGARTAAPEALQQQQQSIQTSPTASAADFQARLDTDPALDYLNVPRPGSGPRPPPAASGGALRRNNNNSSNRSNNTGGTFDELQNLLASLSERSPSTTPNTTPSGLPTPRRATGRVNTASMALPARPSAYSPSATSSSFPTLHLPSSNADLLPPSFRIGPSLGRTVAVAPERGTDVARAFRLVDVKCNANGVRADFMRQRFHERGGVRRKRLVMSRWRRRFKEAFRATVRRVEDMRRKGW